MQQGSLNAEFGVRSAEWEPVGRTPSANTAFRTPHSAFEMVAREGSAPLTSGCRPDAILFHHRAESGCRSGNCTNIRAFKGRCPTIRRPGKELVEPEVVATSPSRIK